jgi:hypothetical protein
MSVVRPELISPEQISEWLGRRVSVESTEPVGTGQVAASYRLRLSDGTSVVAKCPSPDATSRQSAALQRLYFREISFYRELAPSARGRRAAKFSRRLRRDR